MITIECKEKIYKFRDWINGLEYSTLLQGLIDGGFNPTSNEPIEMNMMQLLPIVNNITISLMVDPKLDSLDEEPAELGIKMVSKVVEMFTEVMKELADLGEAKGRTQAKV